MKPNSKYCVTCSKNSTKGSNRNRAMRGKSICWAHEQESNKASKQR